MNQDNEQIKILSIFHYVVAGIAGLFACFPIFHLTMGITMLTRGFFPDEQMTQDMFPIGLFGLMFTLIPAAMILLGWAYTISMAVSGNFLAKKKNFNFVLVMAGISCMFMPFGTVLGIFTIIVLIRPSVKELFGVDEANEVDS